MSSNIVSIEQEDVVQHRGIQYATLPDAFSEPRILPYEPGSHIKATEFGPSAVSLPNACAMEQSLIQHPLPHEAFEESGTDCLNLNLSVPVKADGSLPVFVFFHGGGFMMGSNAWPQYDLARLVRQAVRLNKPVVGVGVNYRLGPAGFLTSEELRRAGYKANNGLRDQRTALQWIQEYIHHFGGDPTRVTVVGESAGGVSCFLHLQSHKPLFSQLASMSGNPLTMKPVPLPVAEASYASVIKGLGLEDKPTAERVRALLETPLQKLAGLGASLPLIPTVDGEIISSGMEFGRLDEALSATWPGAEWCGNLLIGDCQFDGSIMAFPLLPRKAEIAQKLQEAAERVLSEHHDRRSVANHILASYQIDTAAAAATSDGDATLTKVLRFATDILFYASTLEIARAWARAQSRVRSSHKAFVYHFNVPNPWDGPYRGEATHILDVALLFRNYDEHLPDGHRHAAEIFANHFIAFVSGEEPYGVFDVATGGAMVYGPGPQGRVQHAKFVTGRSSEAYGRRGTVFDLANKVGLDALSRVWDEVMMMA
ncbi:Alpha/Beta hydrolase protein [Aspergillus pseudoustus]|uniref:Carboxylic ester hydrolase n=1 Tax=Aspergillus pseudoustus TaxID=1810923 RepID=A0ABR4IM68_9EURO